MKPGLLFEPPPKPRPALRDEEIAVKVVAKLIDLAVSKWSFERGEFSDEDRNDLAEAIMAEDSDDYRFIMRWLRKNRQFTNWRWEDQEMLLEHGFSDACEAVVPRHTRRGRFA